MKFIRFLGFLWLLVPCVSFAAGTSEFQNASKLLSAARRGDIQTVQVLINNGTNVNYVDATGMSLVCTAVMNNDKRAIQILQMYGADASNCDRQIKQYKQKSRVAARGEEYGFFSGLSSAHVLALSVVGAAALVGGVVLLSNAFDSKNNNGSASGGGSHGGGGGGTPSAEPNKLFSQNLPYGPACSGTSCPSDFTVWESSQDFGYMSDTTTQNTFNYLMVSHAYDAFVRGYLGMGTVRNESTKEVFDLSSSKYPFAQTLAGGKPINVAMVTASGVNRAGSAIDGLIYWFDESKMNSLIALCTNATGTPTQACVDAVNASVKMSHKYHNLSGATEETTVENSDFDLTGGGTVFGSATAEDTKLAKIIAGWEEGGRSEGDFYGFIPNGQLTVYKVGTGETGVSDYKNYAAIYDALQLKESGEYVSNVVANLSLPTVSSALNYATVDDAQIWVNAANTIALKKTTFGQIIDTYYNLNTSDDSTVNAPSVDAAAAYSYLGNYQQQILVNPAGHNVIDVPNWKISPEIATFENYAPVVYNDLQNLFMTVVAVKPTNGTKNTSIDEYSASAAGKLELSIWNDPNDSSITYTSRMCGLAGTGNGGAMNPWCFAAPGNTDMEATAAMAGSVALVKSAFNYMSPQEIFLLLALTADGPYLGTNPETNLAWTSQAALIEYLQNMYTLPGNLDASQYIESFKNAFGYGMINLERATRPSTNIYYFSSDPNVIVSDAGNSYWRNATSSVSQSRASSVFSLTNRQAIKTSFFDVVESADGSVSLPRVWNATFTDNTDNKHGLYMGDVLADFSVNSKNRHHNEIGEFSFDMAFSPRAYNDNMNGLDDLRIAFNTAEYEIDAQYQHHFTDGESRFNGRANSLLGLVSNTVSSGAKYKMGNFAFGTRAFSGTITNENLLETDPVVSSQFEPGHLGFANGVSVNTSYNNDSFGFGVSFGNMNETNTLLGSYSNGLLSLNGANTQYVDAIATYKPFEKMKLYARATFANTHADIAGGIISRLSDIKSDAYSIGLDMGGFSFTASLPLAVVDGKMGYDYADLNVVENNGKYSVELNNPHIEYIDLAPQKREMRFSGAYKQSIGEFTDAGVGFIYRVNPNNTNMFGNESVFMLKINHRVGI